MPVHLNKVIIDITKHGQLNVGDLMILTKKNGVSFPAVVKDIINENTDKEEIVFNLKRNLYFIMEMYINDESWIRDCKKVFDGKMYCITNNMNSWVG